MAGRKETKGPENPHQDHRKRVKKEFRDRGYSLTGMPDHRALELLLFYAIPRRDVNTLAHELERHFGGIVGVFHATPEQLMEVEGVGPDTAALIRLVMELSGRYLERMYSFEGRVVTMGQMEQLLRPLFFGTRDEIAYLICMDGKNKVIAQRKLGEGVADAVQITARKVLEAALSCNATRVVLAHNHVSGVALPSEADVATTRRLKAVLAEAGVQLLDHVIFANDEATSMAESGLLND